MVGYRSGVGGGSGGVKGVCGEREGERRAGLEPKSLVGQLDAGERRRMRSGAGRLMNLLSVAARLGVKSQKKEGKEKSKAASLRL